jgi:polygalacturonase
MLLHKYLRFRAPLLLTAVGLFSLAITTLAQSAPPLSVPALPTINTSTIINITNSAWGAVSSTTLTNTTAIQKAINAASATNGGAGATVEFPAGT